MNAGVAATPRPVPSRYAPVIGGTAVVVFGLPVIAVAGWSLQGWAFAAVLWVGAQVFSALLTRLPLGLSNLAELGVRGFGTTFRAVAVGVPLVILTVTNEPVGVVALAVYGLAFTVEFLLTLVIYAGSEARP